MAPAVADQDDNLVSAVKQAVHSSDGAPFVMPSKRGIDMAAPGYDPDSFLDLLGEDVMRIQHQKLHEILSRQASVEYLQRLGLNGRTDVASFRKCVPIVSYGDLEGDIMRLVNGDASNIFSVDPILTFSFSSGTTAGKPKYIPMTVAECGVCVPCCQCGFSPHGAEVLAVRWIPGYIRGGKSMQLAWAGKQQVTPSGIKGGAVTSNLLWSSRFLNRPRGPTDEFSVPDEVLFCDDTSQGLYCHLLCSLAQAPDIVKIYSTFAASVVAAARALQKQWPKLVEDIRTGTLNSKVTEPDMRAAVQATLRPNPDLATRIQQECSQSSWEGIFPRLFPNARFVQCVVSGSMLKYAPALKHFAGYLAIVTTGYASSECVFLGLNPRLRCAPEDITYLLWPESAYFEFIPLEEECGGQSGGEAVKVLEACELEVGKEYELVVTTVTGLYRYHMGDVLRVRSFWKTAPVVEFVRRQNVVLSVHSDKTDEAELHAVVTKACELLRGSGMEVVDYTSTADVSSLPTRYVIFWEMVVCSNLDHDLLQSCANTLDGNFNDTYRRWRSGDHIAPLELRIVREATFGKVMNVAVAKGTSRNQYKPPLCVNNPQALEILRKALYVPFIAPSHQSKGFTVKGVPLTGRPYGCQHIIPSILGRQLSSNP